MFEYKKVIAFLRKNFTIIDMVFIAGIILLFLAIRLINLDQFPIFSDEGIYLNWAKIAKNDANWRFISLTDGKQPLQTWLTLPFLHFFPANALLAGRLVSTLTGLFALTGMFTLLFYVFNKRAAYFGALLYVITPYFIFYDRMALIDSGVNAFFIWILFFSILLVRTNRIDVSIILGIIGGLGLLAKSSVQIFLGLSVFAPILNWDKNKKDFKNRAINYLILLGVSIFIALVMYQIQRLSPFFHYINEKNYTFIMSPKEFLAAPFSVITRNIWLVPYYVFSELSYAVGVVGLIGYCIMFKKDKRLFIYMLLWITIPFIAVGFFSKVLFPRYIIFFGTLLTIMAAYALSQFKNKTYLYGSFSVIIISVLYFNYTLLFDYSKIPFPPVDRGQYIEDWPSGWGAKEIMEYARERSKEKHVIIMSEGNFGMAGDVLNSLIQPGDDITIDGIYPLNLEDVYKAQPKLKDNIVLLVFPHRKEFPPDWPVTLIKKYDKPGNKSALYLLELKKS
jgi:4-amino-4-deoxy-L-arabinose transferase-like glycosyltransferase